MKQNVRYQTLTIPGKLRTDIRISVDDARGAEYTSSFDVNKSTILSLFPIVSITLLKPIELNENGAKAKPVWNPNDTLGMTKYNFPIFINELVAIQQDLKIPELYTYQGKRLELNEETAAKIRRVFLIGNVTIELSAVVVIQVIDETRVEGIKMKFNNEQSSVLLTLNDIDSLIYNLQHTNVDSIALTLYKDYIKDASALTKNYDPVTIKPKVDIIPPKKPLEFESDDLSI